MFVTRLISGIVLLVIMIAAMILGHDVLFVLTAILSFIGLYELYKTYNIHNNMIGYAGGLGALCYILAVRSGSMQLVMGAIVLSFLLVMFVYVFSFPKFNADQAAAGVFGLIYVPVLMMFMYQIRELPDGLYLIPLVFVSACGNDTCAYCVGRLIGRHKKYRRRHRRRGWCGDFRYPLWIFSGAQTSKSRKSHGGLRPHWRCRRSDCHCGRSWGIGD